MGRGCDKVRNINLVWIEAATRSGFSVEEAVTRSGKSTKCG